MGASRSPGQPVAGEGACELLVDDQLRVHIGIGR